jgi:hypothetical protein
LTPLNALRTTNLVALANLSDNKIHERINIVIIEKLPVKTIGTGPGIPKP